MADTHTIRKDIERILRDSFWLPGLETIRTKSYERLHDDHDGTEQGIIQVFFGPDGDGYITTDLHQGPALRFRAPMGVSNSHYVRNALQILAYAIKMDNEEEAAYRAKHPR